MGSIVYNTYRPKMINNNLVDGTTWTQYLQQIPESEVARIYPGYEAAKNRLDTSTPNNLNILNVSGFFLSDGSPLNDELQYQIELEVSASTAHRYFNIIWYNPDTDSFVNTTATSSNGFDMLSYHQSFKTYTPPVVDDKLHYLDNLGLQRFKANIDENLNEIKRTPVTTSGTGAAYVAQVKGINAANIYMVPVGTSFTMIPHTDSTTVKPTLNVNGLGAREIRVKSMVNNDAAIPTEDKFLLRDKPVDVMFDGTYWVCDMTVVDSAAIGLEDIAKKAEDAANAANSAEDKAVKLGKDLPVQIRTGVATAEISNIINDIAAIFVLHTKEQLASMFDIPLNEFYPEFCFCSVENANTELFIGLVNTFSKADSSSENIIVATDILTNGINTDILEVTYTYIYTIPTKLSFVIKINDGLLRFYNRPLASLPRVGDLFDGYIVQDVYLIDENREYNKPSDVPWLSESVGIDELSFKDKISPISTAYWFANVLILQDITLDNLDMSKTVNTSHMFDGANINNKTIIFNANMFAENADMSYMFANSKGNGTIVFNCDVPDGTDMSYMFCDSYNTLVFGKNANTSGAVNMQGMFKNVYYVNKEIFTLLNTENVIDMSHMFEGAIMTSDTTNYIVSIDTSNVVNMESMFMNIIINGDLKLSDKFKTYNVTNMKNMFAHKQAKLPPIGSDLSKIYVTKNFTVDKVVDSDNMFYGLTSLEGGSGTVYDASHVDKTYARIDNPPTEPGYFTEYKQAFAVYSEDDNSLDFYNRGEVPAEGGGV